MNENIPKIPHEAVLEQSVAESISPMPAIVREVTVIPVHGHIHNGKPCNGQPITLTPELAEHLVEQGFAHFEEA